MQLCPSPIQEQPHPSPPRTWSTPLPAPDQMHAPTALPKIVKNICDKTQPQRKTSSKATKGKQPLKQTTLMNVKPKYVRGQPMLTSDQLCETGQYSVDLHNYYI
jgi:hypothetical protein